MDKLRAIGMTAFGISAVLVMIVGLPIVLIVIKFLHPHESSWTVLRGMIKHMLETPDSNGR